MRGRRFGSRERVALFLAAGGHCTLCGDPLSPGWHADHVMPWSLGGSTDVKNGQALCPGCNLRKSIHMPDQFVRRPWGQRALDAAIDKIEHQEKFLLINAFCGSGKTLTFLDICNELYRRGEIDMVLAFSPRVNLCQQYETSWKKFRKYFSGTVLGQICHRTNDPPLIRDCMFDGVQHGVAATYPSLISAYELYADLCKSNRVALIADEAQILGSSFEDEADGTKAAEFIRRLNDLSRFTIEGTGTPIRSDGMPLLFCNNRYGPPDSKGKRLLLADVDATYLEGVTEKYLRPIEVTLVDGKGLREYLDDGSREKLTFSEMSSGMSQLLVKPDIWQPMVDRAIDEIKVIRTIDGRYCLLIGACSQRHAKEIRDYCRKRHADIGILLATSNDPSAQDSLRTFKKGRHAVLITVGMAYIGYDHSWITSVLCLGAFRHFGWLDQFAARAGRIEPERPIEEQYMRVTGPDDRLFRKWANMRRRDSAQGLKLREEKKSVPPTPGRLSIIIDASTTHSSAIGMDPKNDLSPKRFEALHRISQEYNMGAVTLTGLDAFLKAKGIQIDPIPDDPSVSRSQSTSHIDADITDNDRSEKIRSELKTITREIDGMLRARGAGVEWGWAYQQINSQFNCKIGDHGVSTVILVKAFEWAKNILKPQAIQWKHPTSA